MTDINYENCWLGNQQFPLPNLDDYLEKTNYEDICNTYHIHGLGYAYRIATGSYKGNIQLTTSSILKFKQEIDKFSVNNKIYLWLTNSGLEQIFMIDYVKKLAQKLNCQFLQRPDRWDQESDVIFLLPLHQLENYLDIFADKLLSSIIFQEAHLFSNHQYSKYSRYRLRFLTKLKSLSMLWLESQRQESYPLIDDFSNLPVNIIHQGNIGQTYIGKFFSYDVCHQQKFDLRALPYPSSYLTFNFGNGVKQISNNVIRIKPGKGIPSLETTAEIKLALQFAQLKRSVMVVVDSRFATISNINEAINKKAKFLMAMQNMISIVNSNELSFYPFKHNVIILSSGTHFDYSSFVNLIEHLEDTIDATAMIISQDFSNQHTEHFKLLQRYQMQYRNTLPVVNSSSFDVHISSLPNSKNSMMFNYLNLSKKRGMFSNIPRGEMIEFEENGCKLGFYPHLDANDQLGYISELQNLMIKPKNFITYLTAPNHPSNISAAIHQIISFVFEKLTTPKQESLQICWALQDQDEKLAPLYLKLFHFIEQELQLNLNVNIFNSAVPDLTENNCGGMQINLDEIKVSPAFSIPKGAITDLDIDLQIINQAKQQLNKFREKFIDQVNIEIIITTLGKLRYLESHNLYSPNIIYVENTNSIYDEAVGARTINQLTSLVMQMRNSKFFLIGVNDLDFQRLFVLLVNVRQPQTLATRYKYTCANQRQAIYHTTDLTLDNNAEFSSAQISQFHELATNFKHKYLPTIKCNGTIAECDKDETKINNKQELDFKAFPTGVYALSRSKSIRDLMLRSIEQLTPEEGYLPAYGEFSYNLLTFKTKISTNKYLNNLVSFLLSLHDLRKSLIVSDVKIVHQLVPELQQAGFNLTLINYQQLNQIRLSYCNVILIGEPNQVSPSLMDKHSQQHLSASHLRLALQIASDPTQTASFIIFGISKERLHKLLKFSADSRFNLSFSGLIPRSILSQINDETNNVNPLLFYSSSIVKIDSNTIEPSYLQVAGAHVFNDTIKLFIPRSYLDFKNRSNRYR